jgi:hypothetical protein
MNPDQILLFSGIAVEAVFLCVLSYRRVFKMLPFFFAYVVLGVATDSSMAVLRQLHVGNELQLYLVDMSLDTLLQYVVLVELTWSALRHLGVIPRWMLAGIGAGLLVVGLLIWPFTDSAAYAGLTPLWHIVPRLQSAISILRILFFIALAACSHVLSLGWRDRELQVATGLGVYSLASFVGSLLHAHMGIGRSAHVIDVVAGASYLGSLVYWVACFWLPEKTRAAMTPQMERTLLAVAHSARAQRTALGRPATVAEQEGD